MLGGAGLAADVVAGDVGAAAGAVGVADDAAQRVADGGTGGGGDDARFAGRHGVLHEEGRAHLDAAVDEARGDGCELQRRDGEAMTIGDRDAFERAPVGGQQRRRDAAGFGADGIEQAEAVEEGALAGDTGFHGDECRRRRWMSG